MAPWLLLTAFMVIVIDAMVFQLQGIIGIGHSQVIKICQFSSNTMVHLCVCVKWLAR
jgi:hypothetical protein